MLLKINLSLNYHKKIIKIYNLSFNNLIYLINEIEQK